MTKDTTHCVLLYKCEQYIFDVGRSYWKKKEEKKKKKKRRRRNYCVEEEEDEEEVTELNHKKCDGEEIPPSPSQATRVIR